MRAFPIFRAQNWLRIGTRIDFRGLLLIFHVERGRNGVFFLLEFERGYRRMFPNGSNCVLNWNHVAVQCCLSNFFLGRGLSK